MATVIFDLDGTLTKKDTYLPFLGMCLKEFGPRSLSVALLPFYASLYLCGLISNARLKEVFLGKILSGVTLESLEPVSEKFVSALLEHGLNRAAVELLRTHLEKNDRVVLATASFDLYTVKLAARLGIETVVCTRAELKDGALTGRIYGKNCHGPEKLRRLEDVIGEREWGLSIFYTDHYSDLPLLKRASRGVLVNPGLKTRILLRRFNFALLN